MCIRDREQAVELTTEETGYVEKYLEQVRKTSSTIPNGDTKLRARYVAGATTVHFEAIKEKGSDITDNARVDRARITLEYEHPFYSQAIGRYVGQLSSKSGTFYVWKFSKQFEIPLEIARSEDQTMGIIDKEN